MVDELRDKGVSIIYISHRLGEVERLADRVAVLRDGENVGELGRDEISHDRMVSMMVGRDLGRFYPRHSHQIREPLLEVNDLVTATWPNCRLSFTVGRGEIVGVAGLVGAGRTEMLRALFGTQPPISGKILVESKEIRIHGPSDAIRAGMGLVPEDRKLHGLVTEMPVRHNVGLAGLKADSRWGWFRNGKVEAAASRRMVDRLRIKTPSDMQIARFLSGGNQQKVVLGKWLHVRPKLLLLDEPTRGIDVGAKHEIYELMESLASDGLAILFVSSEMEEIIRMSDRALVMREGRLMGQLSREQLTEENVMRLATNAS
ncbi:MAG: sugar ABC transporter ATP-binding protein [Pirellulaceae bacterium]